VTAYFPAVAKDALSSPTFQQVVRGDSFRGLGMRPAFTPRQTLAGEQAYRASTTGCRTLALSGNCSKCFSASGMALLVKFFGMSLYLLKSNEATRII